MKNLDIAVKVLRQGGIIIYPTDTAFGIGCRMDDQEAVKRLFKIRRRPSFQAVPVLVNSIQMAQNYLTPLPMNVRHLINDYWPGALTIIWTCFTEKVPSLVRGNGPNLGVRMPDSRIVNYLVEKIGVPILGPSANFHQAKTPFFYQDIDKELIKLVDYVIKGDCYYKKASSVIDCTKKPWKIIRQGALKINLKRYL